MSNQDNSGGDNSSKPPFNKENTNKTELPGEAAKDNSAEENKLADSTKNSKDKKSEKELTPEEKEASLRVELSEAVEEIKTFDPELLKDPAFVNEGDLNKRVGILHSHIKIKNFLERLDKVEQERIFAELKRERDLIEAIMREERIRRGEEMPQQEVRPGIASLFKPDPKLSQDDSFPLPPVKK